MVMHNTNTSEQHKLIYNEWETGIIKNIAIIDSFQDVSEVVLASRLFAHETMTTQKLVVVDYQSSTFN